MIDGVPRQPGTEVDIQLVLAGDLVSSAKMDQVAGSTLTRKIAYVLDEGIPGLRQLAVQQEVSTVLTLVILRTRRYHRNSGACVLRLFPGDQKQSTEVIGLPYEVVSVLNSSIEIVVPIHPRVHNDEPTVEAEVHSRTFEKGRRDQPLKPSAALALMKQRRAMHQTP
jgi:hypothetical protein